MQKKVQGSEDKTAKAERSRREGDGGTRIFFADCVCVKPVFESYLICVYMNVLSFPHSFRAKFIPLEGKAYLVEKEPTQRRLLDWEPGALGELQKREDSSSAGSENGAGAGLTKGHVFRGADVPFISEKGVSTNKTSDLVCPEKRCPDSPELMLLAQPLGKWTLSRSPPL